MSTPTLWGDWDENGRWRPTDKDGNPLPSLIEERTVKALESIAISLEKMANPLVKIRVGAPSDQVDRDLAAGFRALEESNKTWTVRHG